VSQATQKAKRRAAAAMALAADTEPARAGRYYMDAATRVQTTIKSRELLNPVPLFVLAGIEGLAAAGATQVVREHRLPPEAAGPISAYLAEAHWALFQSMVGGFDMENFGAWNQASSGESGAGHDGEAEGRAADEAPGDGERREDAES
jgi:hypothetical protein